MANIIDYVKDENIKDASFSSEGFNDLDAMILTQFSSFHMNDIGINEGQPISVKEAAIRLRELGTITNKNQAALLDALCESSRYDEVYLSDFTESNIPRGDSSGKTIEQFGAITCSFKDPVTGSMQRYIAFESTDGTLEGWEEDAYMAYEYGTESQERAKEYLERIAGKYDGDLLLGGHSKGGNNAMYAFLECDSKVSDRVSAIKLYDAPGFCVDISNHERYAEMTKKVGGSTYAPYDSVIGLALLGQIRPEFVSTTAGIFYDHDFYEWEIDITNRSFVHKDQSFWSKYFDLLIDEVLLLPKEARELVVKSLFDLIPAIGCTNFDDFLKHLDRLLKIYESNIPLGEKIELTAFMIVLLPATLVTLVVEGAVEGIRWIEKQITTIVKSVYDAGVKAFSWVSEKIEEFRTFIEKVDAAAKDLALSIWNKVKKFFEGTGRQDNGYLNIFERIEINTYVLHSYSGRLRDVNRRITFVDSRLDTLYGRVGLKDLWNLLQADLLTGFSWKLLRCSEYLDVTANEFDRIETKLIES